MRLLARAALADIAASRCLSPDRARKELRRLAPLLSECVEADDRAAIEMVLRAKTKFAQLLHPKGSVLGGADRFVN